MSKFSASLLTVALLAALIGCGPPSGDWSGTSPDPLPPLTDEAIRERINDTRVFDVPPADGNGESISWGFDEDEPKEITIVERSDEGKGATVILDVTTRSTPRAREPKELTGRIKTYWEYETGFAMRRWEIQRTENISMTYKRLPKPQGPEARDDEDGPMPPPLPAGSGSQNINANQPPPAQRDPKVVKNQ